MKWLLTVGCLRALNDKMRCSLYRLQAVKAYWELCIKKFLLGWRDGWMEGREEGRKELISVLEDRVQVEDPYRSKYLRSNILSCSWI